MAREILPGTEEYKRIIAEMGGHKAIRKASDEHTRKCAVLRSLWDRLLEEHPNKWVALTEGDEIVVARSHQALVRKVERLGKLGEQPAFGHLQPNAPAWIR